MIIVIIIIIIDRPMSFLKSFSLFFCPHTCIKHIKIHQKILLPTAQSPWRQTLNPAFFFFFFVLSLFVTEQAAGVYHRESRKGRYQLTYKEAKAVCNYEGGKLATYKQLEAARKIGLYINTSMVDNRFCMRNGYFSHLLVGNLGTNY